MRNSDHSQSGLAAVSNTPDRGSSPIQSSGFKPAKIIKTLLIWITLPIAATTSYLAISDDVTAPDIPAIALSADPLYAPAVNDKPVIALALSVEFPTVGAQYMDPNGTSSSTEDPSYTNTSEYLGYYDAESCYTYNKTGSDAPTGANASDYKRFVRSGAATNRMCDDAFSGNFLNWASNSAIDMLRVALTGGDRYIDTENLTILQRPVDSLTRKWRASRLLNDLALGIIRVGGNAQTNRRQIGFRRTRNILQKFRPAVNTEDEDARRHWIQCSRVTNAARLRQPPPPSNHVVRRQASWLINEEDPGLNETRFDRPCSRSLGCPLFQSWPSRPLRLLLRRQHTAKHHRQRTGPARQRRSLRHSLEPRAAPPR